MVLIKQIISISLTNEKAKPKVNGLGVKCASVGCFRTAANFRVIGTIIHTEQPEPINAELAAGVAWHPKIFEQALQLPKST